MSDTSTSSGGGIGIFGLLGVIFVTCKIVGVAPIAGWSWWWVTAPFWGGLLVTLGLLAVFTAFMFLWVALAS
jgi:hypothetical protein